MASAVASSFQNMKAYNYFQSGHVHDIKMYRVMTMQSSVKLKVGTARECKFFFELKIIKEKAQYQFQCMRLQSQL